MAEPRRTPDIIEAYVKYQNNTEPPEIYKKWCGVSLMASVLQRKVWAKWGTLTFYPNMYIILVGPPGKARKGTAMRLMREHIDKLKITVAAESTTREALIQAIEESAESVSMSENPLVMELYMHSSLTVFSEELTSLIGYQNKEMLANLADWFDCAKSWRYRTKTSGVNEIVNIYLNLIGATTPELIMETMPFDLIGGGLSSRILFIYARSKGKRVIYPELSAEEKILCEDVDIDLEKIYHMKGQFKYSKDFVDLWAKWYMGKAESCPLKSRHLHYYWERRETHLMKLALIMSASRSDEMVIRGIDLEKADVMLTEAELYMPYAFSGMGHRDDASTLASIMNTIADKGTINVQDLLKQYYADVTLEQLHAILTLLQTKAYCSLYKDGSANWKVVHKEDTDG